MRNKHSGVCYRCGKHCEAQAGHFERYQGGWRIQHADCAKQWRGTDREHTRPWYTVKETKQDAERYSVRLVDDQGVDRFVAQIGVEKLDGRDIWAAFRFSAGSDPGARYADTTSKLGFAQHVVSLYQEAKAV